MTASPTCTKAALNLLGHEAGGLRLPLVEATGEELAVVREMLVRHNLLAGQGETQNAHAGAPSAQAHTA
jgi:4-hydroxy-tetrahydrodipicolinate synthase